MLRTEDLPGLFRAADEAAIASQRSYLRSYGLRLLFAVLAAVCAAFSVRVGSQRTDLAALGTALAFVCILTLDVRILGSRPNRNWHAGRILAEATKTLAWKYAVGGAPFDHTLTRTEADAQLVDRTWQLQRSFLEIQLEPTTGTTITDRMRELRDGMFADRRQCYLEHRLQEQQRWYAAKSKHHRRRGGRLRTLALLLEIAGISAALAKAFNAIGFDLAGIVAASIAGIAAWSSARQDDRVSAAYAATSNELALITESVRNAGETDWAAAVDDAEEVINREHALWRAFCVDEL
ncbi:DUF4231 domain-containing protein [Nocardia sp. NPDC004568]|uniref:DUF4231 domain-containing protein n=1 Tax=Nocardia sp. NPDC004568 TaxID=3154551 RepID=UPI0033A18EC8